MLESSGWCTRRTGRGLCGLGLGAKVLVGTRLGLGAAEFFGTAVDGGSMMGASPCGRTSGNIRISPVMLCATAGVRLELGLDDAMIMHVYNVQEKLTRATQSLSIQQLA